jgi:SET domain-containing protein 6
MEEGQKFVNWMKKYGFRLHKGTKFHHYDDERGYALLANNNIRENTRLFMIPHNMVLGQETSELTKKIGENELFSEFDTWNKLIVTIMWEFTYSESLWRPYLDILPLSLNTPLFWNNEDLEWLKGTDVEKMIGYERIKSDFEEKVIPFLDAFPDHFDKNIHNFEMYRRFGSIVMAYSFTKPDGEIVMMPMADMLNHKTGFNNARLFIQNESSENSPYEMKAISNISKGSEIFNTYGDLGNSDLLRKYGFVDGLDNPHNIVTIPLQLVEDTISKVKVTFLKQKLLFLKKNGLLSDEETFLLSPKKTIENSDEEEDDSIEESGFDPLLEFLLKVFHMTKREWKKWRASTTELLKQRTQKKTETNQNSYQDSEDSNLMSDDSDINLNIEIQNMKAFQTTVQMVINARLSLYPTTQEEDMDLLKQNTNYENDLSSVSTTQNTNLNSSSKSKKKKKRKASETLEPTTQKKSQT